MSPAEALCFVAELLGSGGRVQFDQASGGEVIACLTTRRANDGWTIGEGQDLASALEDLRRQLRGSG